MKAVETFQLTKYYSRGAIRALDNVTLSVDSGKIFSLLGPNGAGKTTLIKLLLGIAFPTRGSAKILGTAISDIRSHREVGYLAENHRFPEFLTANQVLYYYGKMSGVNKSDAARRIPQLLQLVNLSDWGDTRIRKYSKGMLQRMGIAQALMSDPQVLFLDEPTDGIDPVGRREIRDLLTRLRDKGKTIFLNSHLLSEVERVSDEIAILKNGQLVRKGPVADFISMKQQYQLQVTDAGDACRTILSALNIPLIPQNGHFVITVEDDRQLNELIDRLRSEEILIRGITPHKISLEDFFIDVIEAKEESAA